MNVEHFSPLKKALQKFGSRVVSRAAGTDLPDAASGFRAYSRESLMVLNTITRFSYCMETIIQAGNKKLRIASVPVNTNPKTRESRLFASTGEHVLKSAGAIIRAFIMYKPYLIFTWLALFFGVLGILPFARYAVLMAQDAAGGHVQSLLLGAVLLILSFLSVNHRHHLRPHSHQPCPDRGHPRTHQEDALRVGQSGAGQELLVGEWR